jgi:hypothetical protein
MLSKKCEFRENRCSEKYILCRTVKDLSPIIFCIIRQIWIKFSNKYVHKNLSSDCKFGENGCSESHTLLEAANEFLSVHSTFIFLFL